MKANIVLFGFMGAGKSTVGELVAQKLNMEFIDTDDYLVRYYWGGANESKKLLKNFSEPQFRKLECLTVKDLSYKENSVIATGGGTVLDMTNYDLLHRNGTMIFLNISLEEAYNRLEDDDSRFLLRVDNKKEVIEKLYLERIDKYNSLADVVIDASKRPEEVCDQIIYFLKQQNK